MLSLWSTIVKDKYMRRLPLDLWIREVPKAYPTSSAIWRSLQNSFLLIQRDLRWQVGRGISIHIGLDPIVCIQHFSFSRALLNWIHSRNMVVLKQVYQVVRDSEP